MRQMSRTSRLKSMFYLPTVCVLGNLKPVKNCKPDFYEKYEYYKVQLRFLGVESFQVFLEGVKSHPKRPTWVSWLGGNRELKL